MIDSAVFIRICLHSNLYPMLINVKVVLIIRQQNKTSETGFFFKVCVCVWGGGLNIDNMVKCMFKHNMSLLWYMTAYINVSMIACSSLDTKARLFYSNYRGTTVHSYCSSGATLKWLYKWLFYRADSICTSEILIYVAIIMISSSYLY